MKILQLYDEKHFPEAEVPLNRGMYDIVFTLARYMVKKEHDVTVLIRREKRSLEDIDDIRVVTSSPKTFIKNLYIELNRPLGPVRVLVDSFFEWREVNKFLKENTFDIIHSHYVLTVCWLIFFNKSLTNKIVYDSHAGAEMERYNLQGKAPLPLKLFNPDIYVMKRVKKSIVLNENVRTRLIREKGIREEKLAVIPAGVDLRKLDNIKVDEDFRRNNNLAALNVLFCGSIIPRKGVECLVKAANIISQARYQINFILAGDTSLDTEYAERMRQYITSHNLPVRLIGFIYPEDLMKFYVTCDIFVLPSFQEGDGLVLKDALVAGKPLIGSNVGGIIAHIKEGWNGFLVEPGNEVQLAEKLKSLIDHPEERIRMGRNSRILAEEKFDWNRIVERYLEIYKDVTRTGH